MLTGRPDVPYEKRAAVARFIEDITASYAGGWMSVISLHGGGSPEAMKGEIHRRYPFADRKALVERLIDRGLVADEGDAKADATAKADADSGTRAAQPGQCCDAGCEAPPVPAPVAPKIAKLAAGDD